MVSKWCEMDFVPIHMAFGVLSVGSEVGFTPFYFQVFGSSGRMRGFCFPWVGGEVMMMAAGCFLVLDLELQASLWFLTCLSFFSCFVVLLFFVFFVFLGGGSHVAKYFIHVEQPSSRCTLSEPIQLDC